MLRTWQGLGDGRGSVTGSSSFTTEEELLGSQFFSPPPCPIALTDAHQAATWEARALRGREGQRASLQLSPDPGQPQSRGFATYSSAEGSCLPVTLACSCWEAWGHFHIFLIFWLSCKNSSMRKFKQCANKAACWAVLRYLAHHVNMTNLTVCFWLDLIIQN